MHTLGYICRSVWALHSVSPSSVCLSLPLILCLSLLQSSPQNRPLIIVWCASGSAVRSYKKRLDVFIADRQREVGAPLAGRWRQITEARPGDLSSRAVKQQALPIVPPPPSSSSPTLHGSSVRLARFGCIGLGWMVKQRHDPEIPYNEVCARIHEYRQAQTQAHYIHIHSLIVSMESHS